MIERSANGKKFLVCRESTVSILDNDYKIVTQFKHAAVGSFYSLHYDEKTKRVELVLDGYSIRSGSRSGFLDRNLHLVIPIEYDDVDYRDVFVFARKGARRAVYDSQTGKMLTPLLFAEAFSVRKEFSDHRRISGTLWRMRRSI